jgi:hypothetical protein
LQTLVKRRFVEVMANKKTQIGFRVTGAVRRQVEAECLKRGLSVQDLFTSAFEHYREETTGEEIFINLDDEELTEEIGWMTLWENYIETMPREQVLIFADAMKFGLQQYKSSRRKKRSGRPGRTSQRSGGQDNRQGKEGLE